MASLSGPYLGPPLRIINVPPVRAHTPEMVASENTIRILDEAPPASYFIHRGLDLFNGMTQLTPLGMIEDHLAKRLRDRSSTPEPVQILTIGPGQGHAEAHLKDLFSNQIDIDSFGLTNTITNENRPALRRLFLGNMDVSELPRGYDLILSCCGVYHACDPNWVFDQIVASLNVGGEACFDIDSLSEFIPMKNSGVKKILMERHHLTVGLRLLFNGVMSKAVYLKKRGTVPSLEVVQNSIANGQELMSGIVYQKTAKDPLTLRIREDLNRDIAEMVGKLSSSRGSALDQAWIGRHLVGHLSGRLFGDIATDLETGFTLEQAIDRNWSAIESLASYN